MYAQNIPTNTQGDVSMKQDMIAIIDLGSEENSAIARLIRSYGVYSEIYAHDITLEALKKMPNVKGVILNGGPNRVVDGVKIDVSQDLYSIGVPFLAIDHDTDKCPQGKVSDIKSFIFDTCHCDANWNMDNFIQDQVELLRKQIGNKKVLLALSGGVDSSVVAALLIKAIGNQLVCVHVNHGLLRKGEPEQVVRVFREELGANLIYSDSVDRFLDKLAGVEDPEKKRKIIGAEFIRVFEEEAKKIGAVDFLVQGTIYPDIIESGLGNSAVIKSHHNVGGLPDYVDFKEIIEPLRLLFKDEVRKAGLELNIPENLVYRQPFPGPGLGIRIIGEVTPEKVRIVQDADAIYREEIANAGLDKSIGQYFAALTNMRSVGVMGDERTYDYAIALRAVTTSDFMTAESADLPWEVLGKVTTRIVNEVKGVNRVLYDCTGKPPATIEFE